MRWHSVVLSARTSTKTHLGHGRSGAGQLLGRRGITAAASASEDQVFCCSGGGGGSRAAARLMCAGPRGGAYFSGVNSKLVGIEPLRTSCKMKKPFTAYWLCFVADETAVTCDIVTAPRLSSDTKQWTVLLVSRV